VESNIKKGSHFKRTSLLYYVLFAFLGALSENQWPDEQSHYTNEDPGYDGCSKGFQINTWDY